MINKIKRKTVLFIINSFLSTTRYFVIKRVLLNFSGISVGKGSKIVGPIYIGTVAQLTIGEDSWIGSGLNIYGNGIVKIGDKCDLAPDIGFITGSHEIGNIDRRAGLGVTYEIEVQNGCWVGARSTIMGNVTIFESSIIGTCSLVNKNVIENTIVTGIPAKVIKVLEI